MRYWKSSIEGSTGPSPVESIGSFSGRISRLCSGLVAAILIASHGGLVDNAEAADNPVEVPSHCDLRERETRPITDEAYAKMIGICGSGQMPGTPEFNKFWARITGVCSSGETPIEIWEKLYNDRLVSQYNFRPSCEQIQDLARRFDVPGSGQDIVAAGRIAKDQKARALYLLRQSAAKGSADAKFLLAIRLLDIENHSSTYKPQGWLEAIETFGELAKSGHADAVYKLLLEMRQKYPEPPGDNVRHEMFLFMYGQLANANDPRGHIGLAEEFVRKSSWSRDHGNSAAASDELRQAKEYLDKAKQFATAASNAEISKLDSDIERLEKGNIGFAEVLVAFAALSILFGQGDVVPQAAPSSGIDPCLGSKEAVLLDPSLATPVALFGCAPY